MLNIQKQTIKFFLSFLLFGIISNIRQNNKSPSLSATSANTVELIQKIKAPYLKEFRVNNKLIKSGSTVNQLVTFGAVINSGDIIDVKIKNSNFQQMGFSATLQFYDKNGKIKTLDTFYAKWTCEGLIPVRIYGYTLIKLFKFNLTSSSISKSLQKESANEEYSCSVVVPENTPLIQQITADSYLSEIKINGESLKLYDNIVLFNTILVSFVLNYKDKLDIKIRNNEGPMGLLASLKYYDPNGNIKSFDTEYADWTCNGTVPIKYLNTNYTNNKLFSIAKKKGDAEKHEAYWCSVKVPIQQPLPQRFTVDDFLTNVKVNGKSLLLQTISANENIPFSYPINAGDTIDMTIRNFISSSWLRGTIQYYDSKGKIRTLDTNYSGWTCNGKPAIKIGNGFNDIMKISISEGIFPLTTSYVCSVKIPDSQPLIQKLKADNFLTSFKVNDKNVPIQSITFPKEVPISWTLNSGDKVDIGIKNKDGQMGLCAKLQFYDPKGIIRIVTTDYAGWTCADVTPVKTNFANFENINTISTKSVNSGNYESYTCSMTIPKQQPLKQKIKAMDLFLRMTVNDQIIKLEQFKKNENIPFTLVLNSGDKIDIIIKNISGQMGLSAKLQYYDKNGSVKIFTTENKGWTCDGKLPVIFENKSYSADGAKFIGTTSSVVNDNRKYSCTVIIP